VAEGGNEGGVGSGEHGGRKLNLNDGVDDKLQGSGLGTLWPEGLRLAPVEVVVKVQTAFPPIVDGG